MPTRGYTVRLSDEEKEPFDRRAAELGLDFSRAARAAIGKWADGADARERRLATRVKALEQEVLRLQNAAQQDAAQAEATAEDDFARAIQEATPRFPATRAGLITVTRWGDRKVERWLTSLVAAGYIDRFRKGRYIPMPGKNVREGMEAVRDRPGGRDAAQEASEAPAGRNGSSPVPAPREAAAAATETAGAKNAATKEGPRKRTTAATGRPRKLAAQRAVREAAEEGSPRRQPSRPVAASPDRAAVVAELKETVPGLRTASELAAPVTPVFVAGPEVDCLHDNMRIGKGVCPDCKQWVTK